MEGEKATPPTCKLTSRPPLVASSFRYLRPERFDQIKLYVSGSGGTKHDDNYRYHVTVVDRRIKEESVAESIAIPCAVFLIPAGRETEYLFNTKRGLLNIAKSANCARLLAVAFNRNMTSTPNKTSGYNSVEQVQTELTTTVQLLAQKGTFLDQPGQPHRKILTKILPSHPHTTTTTTTLQIPFMALDGIGQRNVLVQGETPTTGRYLVEQVQIQDKRHVRRLYFLKNQNVIQTEICMNQNGTDFHGLQLAFSYHQTMAAGYLALSNASSDIAIINNNNNNKKRQALVIGLGGGALPTFLHLLQSGAAGRPRLFSTVTTVELDPGVVEIAQQHFGFQGEIMVDPVDGEKNDTLGLQVILGNGLHVGPSFVPKNHSNDTATTTAPEDHDQKEDDDEKDPPENSKDLIGFPPDSLHLIAIDVDSKDVTVGMSCPPLPFVHHDYLSKLRQLLSPHGGVLAVNISARDPTMLASVRSTMVEVFGRSFLYESKNAEEEEGEEEDDGEEEERLGEDLNVVLFATRMESNTTMHAKESTDKKEQKDTTTTASIQDATNHEEERTLWIKRVQQFFHPETDTPPSTRDEGLLELQGELEQCAAEITTMRFSKTLGKDEAAASKNQQVANGRRKAGGGGGGRGAGGAGKKKGKGGKKKGKRR